METVGIVLAGGKGTRLGELTKVTNKHLLPVGREPMIYHPIRKLTAAGITRIMIVTGTEHMGDFVELLGSGRQLGADITYRVQESAGGIAEALGLASRFAKDCRSVVLLGDNIFYSSLNSSLLSVPHAPNEAVVMIKRVRDASRFGVAEIFQNRIVGIEEKPRVPKSDFAVTGLYAYPPDVFSVIRDLTPSARGEREITDVNRTYLERNALRYGILEGYWTDAGTFPSLAQANVNVSGAQPSF